MRVPMTSILENENEPITTQNESIKEFVVDNMKVKKALYLNLKRIRFIIKFKFRFVIY